MQRRLPGEAYAGDVPDVIRRERDEVKRLRGLLDRILNCVERRCFLCDQCLHAARDVDRPTLALPDLPRMTAEERDAFFRDLQAPAEITEPTR